MATLQEYLYWLSLPKLRWTDVLEIIIISFLLYQILGWVKSTRAWTLFKGIIVILMFTIFAMVFQLNAILWILSNTLNVGIIAVIIVFQPELRRALEQLGRKNIIGSIIPFDEQKEGERFSERTISEIIKATVELSKTKTGALIVMEEEVALGEYERTGIPVDAIVSSQLLVNIFEHNTPLHDGAVLIRKDRIVAATCYLPLTDSLEVNKELGTRHRAAIGISEVSDSITIIVSEETGSVSITKDGKIIRNVDGDKIRKLLGKSDRDTKVKRKWRFWKGRE
ncbi:MAG: TIGR00159 family protein [Firmicutes bacterium]|uniref:Diadenylate cyclase n=1 Tax=Candidatus Scybalomonas excrementavium TaxID=2840943 RepID=A0A9D9I0X8_9FIRM|nr:TIGR00159 family protein [Candidatus Scybalomonas excrementavium]